MALTLQAISPSPLGTSYYSFTGISAPAQYVPTAEFTAKRNKSNTNTDVTVLMKYPILQETEGVTTIIAMFQCSFSFTSLRTVVSETERARIFDEMTAFLTTNKARILAGSVLPVS